jgi:predicted MFS family arabinose efflux permease
VTRRSTSDRRLLLVAGAFSSFAAQTSIVTLPLVAVVGLHADPAQVGILSALGTMPFVALGLPVGAWVDRLDHRRILLAAEVIRTLLLATVPLAYWLHHLCLGHLFVVAALAGCATVFFDVATQSAIPRVVTPHALVRTNTDLNTIWGVSNIAGRGLAGLVVAAISAPWTMSVAAGVYLGSVLALRRLPPGLPVAPADRPTRPNLIREVTEGLRHVLGNRELRALAWTAAQANLGSAIITAMLPILIVREAHFSSVGLGVFLACGGAGLLAGARAALSMARRLGVGTTLAGAGVTLAPMTLLVPLFTHGVLAVVAAGGWFMFMFKLGLDNVLGVSLRQRLTDTALQGRMNATFRVLLTGALSIGAALSGGLGDAFGVRDAMWVGAAAAATAGVAVLVSPVRRRSVLPEQVTPRALPCPSG